MAMASADPGEPVEKVGLLATTAQLPYDGGCCVLVMDRRYVLGVDTKSES